MIFLAGLCKVLDAMGKKRTEETEEEILPLPTRREYLRQFDGKGMSQIVRLCLDCDFPFPLFASVSGDLIASNRLCCPSCTSTNTSLLFGIVIEKISVCDGKARAERAAVVSR